VFGYINWYKGIDWIVKASKAWKGKNIRLLIAGGPNPYHMNKAYYQKYYHDFLRSVANNVHITHTGFVADNDIRLYFSAADLAVLPYRVLMAASGPFALALSYNLPVILSDRLADYVHSADFKKEMQNAGLDKEDLFFPLNEKKLSAYIHKAKTDKQYYVKLVAFSQALAQARSNDNVISQLQTILFPPSIASRSYLALPKTLALRP